MNATSFLYIDTLHCIRQYDLPPDADTPYLLVFAGQRTPCEADVMRVTSQAWQNSLRSGDSEHPRTWVHHHVRSDTVLMVALIEQNWRIDMQDARLDALRDSMQQRWHYLAKRMQDSASLALASHHAFASQIQDLLRNDTLIEVQHLPVSTPHGTLPELNFNGQGAHYRVHFRTQVV